MERSELSEDILALGRRLIDELGLEDTRADALSRWMAFDIAQRMKEAEIAVGPERDAARQACSDAILTLWTHRMAIPNGRRPMHDAENTARILSRVDPESRQSLFFRSSECSQDPSNPWLQKAIDIDRSARGMLRACVRLAAKGNDEKSVEFSRLAEAAGLGRDADTTMLRVVLFGGADEKPNADELLSRQITTELKALQDLSKLTKEMKATLRHELSKLPSIRPKVAKADTKWGYKT